MKPMADHKQKNLVGTEDAFLDLCQRFAELSQGSEAVLPVAGEDDGRNDTLDQRDDWEAERKILLWRILNEAARPQGDEASEPRRAPSVETARTDESPSPPREIRQARGGEARGRGAFMGQLTSLLRAPFRSSDDRRFG
jgi:hypothetical protein